MNARGKSLDTTFLSLDQAEDRMFIHRDYIAHCLRWTHVVKRLFQQGTYKTAVVLDVGCGRELPLAKLMYTSRIAPLMYFGVDAGPINDEDSDILSNARHFRHKVWERTNILEIGTLDLTAPGCDEKLKPNFVTCFEVLEHVEPRMMIAMLEHVKSLATDDAEFYFSTPCWNRVDCADNHVNEMLYQSLGSLFERRGFDIVRVSGTFASIRDYQHLLRNTPWGDLNHLFDALRGHYDSNFLSCIFAPLFPANSRNCLWELRKHDPIDSAYTPKFPKIHEIERPWSSSALWTEMEL